MTRARATADTQDNNGGSVSPVVAGKNLFLNGSMDFWQRGTSIGTGYAYTADRWFAYRSGAFPGMTVSRQTANLTGFQYCARVQRDNGNSTANFLRFQQVLETVNSIPLAGSTVTLSYYARAGANYSSSGSNLFAIIYSGTGTDQNGVDGFTGYAETASQTVTLTSSWQRFTVTGTVSASATQLAAAFAYNASGTAGAADFFEITGVQLEVGSVATPFSRAAGTVQGELAACQRYYYLAASGDQRALGMSYAFSSSLVVGYIAFPVTMRTFPTLEATSGTSFYEFESNPPDLFDSLTIYRPSLNGSGVFNNSSFAGTQGQAATMTARNASTRVAFNAEL